MSAPEREAFVRDVLRPACREYVHALRLFDEGDPFADAASYCRAVDRVAEAERALGRALAEHGKPYRYLYWRFSPTAADGVRRERTRNRGAKTWRN